MDDSLHPGAAPHMDFTPREVDGAVFGGDGVAWAIEWTEFKWRGLGAAGVEVILWMEVCRDDGEEMGGGI